MRKMVNWNRRVRTSRDQVRVQTGTCDHVGEETKEFPLAIFSHFMAERAATVFDNYCSAKRALQVYMLGLCLTSQINGSSPSNCLSCTSMDKAGVLSFAWPLQILDYGLLNHQNPIQTHHRSPPTTNRWPLSGRILPLCKDAVSVFLAPAEKATF